MPILYHTRGERERERDNKKERARERERERVDERSVLYQDQRVVPHASGEEDGDAEEDEEDGEDREDNRASSVGCGNFGSDGNNNNSGRSHLRLASRRSAFGRRRGAPSHGRP